MVVLGFAGILSLPFALGCAAMALPVTRVAKVVIAVAPVLLLALAVTEHFFWIGDPGGFVILVIATWAWLLGVGLSGDVRSVARFAVRLARG